MVNRNFEGNLDIPLDNQNISPGFMLTKGWAFESGGKDLNIDICIDDSFVTRAHYGLPRYDIFKKFFTNPSYESGFIARIPLRNFDFGNHKLSVYAKDFSNDPFREVSFVKIKKKGNVEANPPLAAGQVGQFRKAGQEYLEICKSMAGLRPNEKILEIGCGMGRFSLAFSRYIDSNGSYDAIDTMPKVIEYCLENISAKFPNFNFQLIDVYNEEYNKQGKFNASEYKFPFESNTFDFVFLYSVFTHLIPKDLTNYLKEISRVLKTGGRCLISYILYNEDRLQMLEKNKYNFPYTHKFDNYRLIDPKKPENAIAYDENFIRQSYKENNLEIQEPIHYISPNKKGERKRQDFIIAYKK